MRAWLAGLGVAAVLALIAWLISLAKRDASVVDIAWSALVVAPALTVAATEPTGPRGIAALGVASIWALRLALHIAWRHHGQPEDRRYQAIRARNEPHFGWKSLYLVFGLQAVLGWVVSAPLAAAVARPAPWSGLDTLGLAVAATGLGIEAVADGQLARFRSSPNQRGRVLDTGLWRYSRHPNYFGECTLWWGLWLVALAAGAAWTIVSPLLMTWLLLRISGVTLLEHDIADRRPAYADYVRRTNAFVPGRPRP